MHRGRGRRATDLSDGHLEAPEATHKAHVGRRRGFETTPATPEGSPSPTTRPERATEKIEGAPYVPRRGSNPAILAIVNDNDFRLVVPIPEQLDVLSAPAVCDAETR